MIYHAYTKNVVGVEYVTLNCCNFVEILIIVYWLELMHEGEMCGALYFCTQWQMLRILHLSKKRGNLVQVYDWRISGRGVYIISSLFLLLCIPVIFI